MEFDRSWEGGSCNSQLTIAILAGSKDLPSSDEDEMTLTQSSGRDRLRVFHFLGVGNRGVRMAQAELSLVVKTGKPELAILEKSGRDGLWGSVSTAERKPVEA